MAVGNEKCFLIDENKQLWCADISSNVGHITTEFKLVPELKNIACKAVEATTHYLILTEEGDVYSFGQNLDGQCGLRSLVNSSQPMKILLSSRIIDIAAGYYFSLMLDENGIVWVCGNNTSGKLGCAAQKKQRQPIKLENLPSINSVSAGYNHSLLLDVEGNVWAFGANGYGQLGLGITGLTTVNVPTKLELPPIAAIAAGNYFSLFLDKDGFVWGCGSNANAGCLESDAIRIDPYKLEYLPNVVSISASSNGSFISDAAGLYSTHYANVYSHISPGHKVHKQAVKIYDDVAAVASGVVSQLILDNNFDVYLRTVSDRMPQKIQTPQMGRAHLQIKSANKLST